MNSFIYKSAIELAQLIRNGEATSVQIVQEHLAHIKKHNPLLNAVIILIEEEALRTAAECDEETQRGHSRGALHGVPMTIKEQFWLKGTKSTLNSKMLKNWTATEDAVIVERLKKAGAVIMGKTNVPLNLLDFQVSGEIYPDGKNPFNPDHSPGGSSGGAAAAVASGMTPIELGADFGGSIRVPSHYCGVYGLKPTENTVPMHGNIPKLKVDKGYIFNMQQAGPLARTLEDLELVWQIIKGPHESDRTTPRIAWQDPSDKTLDNLKIAWADGWQGYETSEQTRITISQFIKHLNEHGGKTTQKTPENNLHERSLSLYVRLFPQVIAHGLPWYFKIFLKWLIKLTILRGLDKYLWEYRHGFKTSLKNYSETMGIRAGITQEWEEFFKNYDLLICPMSYGPAFRRGKTGKPITYNGKTLVYLNYVWPYVACFYATGLPALNIPLGIGKEGLPLGIQVVGPYWSEPLLLHFAKLVSGFTPGFVKPMGY